jgi:hypothetical protein
VIAGEGSYIFGQPTIAPDGSAIVTFSPRGSLFGLELVRIDDERRVPLSSSTGPVSVGWTPDGRFVLFGDGEGVNAYDTVTGEPVVLPDELPSLAMFELRSLSG